MLEIQHIENFWELFINLCISIAQDLSEFVDAVIYWTTEPLLSLFVNELGLNIGSLWFVPLLPQQVQDFITNILSSNLLSLMITSGISITIAWVVLSAIFKLIDAINPA